MAKRTVVALGLPLGQKHYRVVSQHPELEHKLDNGDLHYSPAPPAPGIVLLVGVPTEIEIKDARHERILREDRFLKFVDAPEAKVEEPELEAEAEVLQDNSRKGKKK